MRTVLALCRGGSTDREDGSVSRRLLLHTRPGRLMAGAVLVLFLATLVGLVALWAPDDRGGDPRVQRVTTLAAEVVSVREEACPGTRQACRSIVARVDEGPDRGERTRITLGPVEVTPDLDPGDGIRVSRAEIPEGATAEAYAYVDRERRGPQLWLAIVFAVLLVGMARVQGLWALLGFAASLALVVEFLVPAMLEGTAPLLVALVGALAVMFLTVLLTYGLAAQSLAAILGIAASLAVAALLGQLLVDLTGLDGRGGDTANALAFAAGGVSLQGIVLAGMVLGALGVLADTAVTQASAVLALRRANPDLTARGLYAGAFSVGRDHLVATTHTLVLAYVGASLPLLLLLDAGGVSGADLLNSPEIAEPVVATLVGSIALLLSVPLTTALSSVLVARMPVDALPAGGGHHHHHAH